MIPMEGDAPAPGFRVFPSADGSIPAEENAGKPAALCAFPRRMPLCVEIGMGKGAFLLEMARRHPETAFLGVERYESVLLRAVQKMEALEKEAEGPAEPGPEAEPGAAAEHGAAAEQGDGAGAGAPENLRFFSADASMLPALLGEEKADRIFLNFSDPWPKKRNAKRRLTSPQFLSVYEKILVPGGELVFKTDNTALFEYSLSTLREQPRWEVTAETRDLHGDIKCAAEAGLPAEENVMTEYERRFSNLGNKIFRLKAVFR